jgi:prepilin-type processing-associated H-X9-DG protein
MIDTGPRTTIVNYPANYHNGACGFSFADGHSEIKKWLDPRTSPAVKMGVYIGSTYLSVPNDGDIAWIQQRCSSSRR